MNATKLHGHARLMNKHNGEQFRLTVYAEGGCQLERQEPGIGWVYTDLDNEGPQNAKLATELRRWATQFLLVADNLEQSVKDWDDPHQLAVALGTALGELFNARLEADTLKTQVASLERELRSMAPLIFRP